MSAKYYVYRNLHGGLLFSIKHRGVVVARYTDFVAHNIAFKVSEPGRLRVIQRQQKNVHAYVVAESYGAVLRADCVCGEIRYNPYLAGTFMCRGEPINHASRVLFTGGKCYLLDHEERSQNL